MSIYLFLPADTDNTCDISKNARKFSPTLEEYILVLTSVIVNWSRHMVFHDWVYGHLYFQFSPKTLFLTYGTPQEICTRFALCHVFCDWPILPTSFRVVSLASGEIIWSCNCPSAREATLTDMGKYFFLFSCLVFLVFFLILFCVVSVLFLSHASIIAVCDSVAESALMPWYNAVLSITKWSVCAQLSIPLCHFE